MQTRHGRAQAPATEETEVIPCAICLEPLQSGARVTLPCGHNDFCGQCMTNHLLRDLRCPICRNVPNPFEDDEEDGYFVDDDHALAQERAARRQQDRRAMALAKRKAKEGDRQAKKSVEALDKWKADLKAKSPLLKSKKDSLRVQEKVMFAKVTAYEKKLEDKFERKYGGLQREVDALRKDVGKARACAWRIERHLKRKYGPAVAQ